MTVWLSLLNLVCSISEGKIIDLKNLVTDVIHKIDLFASITFYGHIIPFHLT